MKKFTLMLGGTLLVGGVAFANDKGSHGGMMGGEMHGMMTMMGHMQTIDANGDGKLSKEEFIKSHEAMFDSMPKGKDGMVDMKDMSKCPMMAGQKPG